MGGGYYDLDCILAQEEWIPCTTLFDFSRLAHLLPEHLQQTRVVAVVPSPTSRNKEDATNGGSTRNKQQHHHQQHHQQQHYLPESSTVKMPLWACQRWAQLGFVKVSLPKHFRQSQRERLAADPQNLQLSKISERYYMGGCQVMDLVEGLPDPNSNSSSSTDKRTASSAPAAAASAWLQAQRKETSFLRTTLLRTYTGERLRRTLDLAMSSVGDDVTFYTKRLTQMERRLYTRGASGAAAFFQWKSFGNRRIQVGRLAQRARMRQHTDGVATTTTPQGSTNSSSNRKNGKNDKNSRSRTRTVTPPTTTTASAKTGEGKRQRVW